LRNNDFPIYPPRNKITRFSHIREFSAKCLKLFNRLLNIMEIMRHCLARARVSCRAPVITGNSLMQGNPILRNPYGQLPSVNPCNGSSGVPCNGAACGADRGRPCVRSSIAQAADTRAASLVPFCAMSANASIAICTCPSSNPDSAARIAAVSAF